MKKTIKFADDLAQLILKGEKSTTWRLFDDKDLKAGDEVDFINKQTMEKFGEATLLDVSEKTLGGLQELDWIGHEKCPDEATMYATYKKYYPSEVIGENTKVKIIKFDFRML
jgi:hypothetical protein